MIYAFGDCELDMAAIELRRGGAPVHVEPQVFALIARVAEARGQVVTKDELIQSVWNGRIVSDAALSSRIKSARQALGDDGVNQKLIRTVHGRGVRFMANVQLRTSLGLTGEDPTASTGPKQDRPSIAVLPFATTKGDQEAHLLSHALTHELIAALSRMRWFTIIARGTAFRFRSGQGEPGATASFLGMRYELSGTFEVSSGQAIVTVTLLESATCKVVWGERFAAPLERIHELRESIVQRCCAALEFDVPAHEVSSAQLSVPERLDAWQCFHLGLNHLYRFTPADTARAMELFERTLAAAPQFARAHAGLSFAHFQEGFMRYPGNNPEVARDQARASSVKALECDPLDAFSNFTMGRSFWLAGQLEESVEWLERASTLNPNFAQAHYALGWTHTLQGKTLEGAAAIDLAELLSPLDPLRYGMIATRALGALGEGNAEAAAKWGAQAARTPGAHALISLIALAGHALAGDKPAAEGSARQARERQANVNMEHFFAAFPFSSEAARRSISDAFRSHGF